MQHRIFTIVALAISAACSSASFAGASPAADQCNALINQQKVAEAEPFCAKAAEEPGKLGKLLYADWHAHKGDMGSARKRYSEILAGVDLAKPTQIEYTALRNRAFLGLQYQESYAENDVRSALKLVPDDVELLNFAASSSPSPGQRLECAERLIALDPKSVEAHVSRSFALTSLMKVTEALAAADTAAKLDSKSSLPAMARGYAYAQSGEHAKAEREYAAAARKAPEVVDHRLSQAEMLGALKRYEDAVEVLSAAVKVRPNYPRALQMRAGARLYMGDAEGALADIAAALKIDPNFDVAGLQNAAEEIQEAQKVMRPESIASMEQDRLIVLGAIKEHMHRKCGHYSVPDYEDNDNLNNYRSCLEEWYKAADENFAETVSREAIEAANRFEEKVEWIEKAEPLQCSNMPKNARCIPDSLYARMVALSDTSDPKRIVGVEEFERVNRGVIAYNKSIKRQDALINTANFLNALAAGLRAQ